MRNHFWGTIAIIFGSWEAIAFGTKWIPTISRTNWYLHKYGWKGKLPAIGFILGLAKHLLWTPKNGLR